MRLYKFKLMLLLWAVSALFSCGKVQNPTVKEFKQLEILSQTDSTLQLAAILVMQNPNGIEIPLSAAEYTISILDKKIGEGKEKNLPPLKAESETELPLKPVLKLATFSEIVPNLLNQETVEVQIDGKYFVTILGQNIPISSKNTSKINIQDLLQKYMQSAMQDSTKGLKVENLRIGKADLMQTLVLADATFTNGLPLEFELQKIHLAIFPPQKEKQNIKLGEWNMNKSQVIKPKEAVKLPIEITLSNLNLLATMPDILSKKNKQSFFVKGTIDAIVGKNTFQIPVEQIVHL